MKHLTCEICGEDIVAKAGGVFVCTGCGMHYDRDRIREMAAQYHQRSEENPPDHAAEPSQVPAPQKKFLSRKIRVGIGAAVIVAVALLMLMPPLLKKSGKVPQTEIPASVAAACVETENAVEEDIEGLWYYEDAEIGYHEEHYFCGGLIASISWLDSAPEKANNSVAEYEVLDGQVRRRSLETDYVLYYDYYYEGDELVLSWYIDSGRGAGSSRIYRKVSNSSAHETSVPENFSEAPSQESTGQTVTTGMKNALNKADSYLQIMAFSRDGLIGQLEYDGFTYSEAVYGADHCNADWYEQAARKAKSYLDIMSFSRQRLIEQLEYDGFSYDQAVYGVDKVY